MKKERAEEPDSFCLCLLQTDIIMGRHRGGDSGGAVLAVLLILVFLGFLGGLYYYAFGNPFVTADGSSTTSIPSGSDSTLTTPEATAAGTPNGTATTLAGSTGTSLVPAASLGPSTTVTPKLADDQLGLGTWRIWTDAETLNFINNVNSKVFRINGTTKNMTSETWKEAAIGAQPSPDYYHFEKWSLGCDAGRFVIQCRTNEATFEIAISGQSVVTKSVAPKDSPSAVTNDGFPRRLEFKSWWIETDAYEMRFVHLTTKNTLFLNKNGMTWDKRDDSGYNLGNSIKQGQAMSMESYLTSPNGGLTAKFQTDGNFVVREGKDGKLRWSAGSNGKNGAILRVLPTGNVVIARTDGQYAWESGTAGKGTGPYKMMLLDDAKLVVRDSKDADFGW